MEQGVAAKVGVTALPKWMALQPVKKNIADSLLEAQKHPAGRAEYSASNGEASVYSCNRKYLAACGVSLDEEKLETLSGIAVPYGARVVLQPSFAVTSAEMKQRVADTVKMTARSTLVLEGNVVIKRLDLDGALIVRTGRQFG